MYHHKVAVQTLTIYNYIDLTILGQQQQPTVLRQICDAMLAVTHSTTPTIISKL